MMKKNPTIVKIDTLVIDLPPIPGLTSTRNDPWLKLTTETITIETDSLLELQKELDNLAKRSLETALRQKTPLVWKIHCVVSIESEVSAQKNVVGGDLSK